VKNPPLLRTFKSLPQKYDQNNTSVCHVVIPKLLNLRRITLRATLKTTNWRQKLHKWKVREDATKRQQQLIVRSVNQQETIGGVGKPVLKSGAKGLRCKGLAYLGLSFASCVFASGVKEDLSTLAGADDYCSAPPYPGENEEWY
jgi:hypothetical protein